MKIKIPVMSPRTLCLIQALPACCSVTCARKTLRIHKTLNCQNRVAIGFFPVTAQTIAAQSQHSAGQIRIATSVRQKKKPAVLYHKFPTLEQLLCIPAYPRLPPLEVIRCHVPAYQGDPLPIQLGHLPQLPTNQTGVLQVMVFRHQIVPYGLFIRPDRTNCYLLQNFGIGILLPCVCFHAIHLPNA